MPSPAPRRAVLDVGSNSLKLLVAEVHHGSVLPLAELSEQTRLGQGLFQQGRLLPDAIQRTTLAASRLIQLALSHQPSSIRVIATAAVREAPNRSEFIDAFLSALQLPVEILSGEQEANLGYQGVCTDPQLDGHRLLVSDLGGGSTELTLGHAGQRLFSQSFPLGTVRTSTRFPPEDPPSPATLATLRQELADLITRDVQPALQPHLDAGPPPLYVAVGGTATILARLAAGLTSFDRSAIESVRLDLPTLTSWTNRLWSLPLAERQQLPGLPPERADIMLAGAVIQETLVRHLGLTEWRPSTRGLRYAALLDAHPAL
jgi:exopolyphosphatase/guanosine-5'-triphosphate,3'-diphosphate pyrophosphatase